MMILGESPGRQEVQAKRPFVGKSGVYLNKCLQEAGIDRSQVWVSNAILCFPPGGSLLSYRAGIRLERKEAIKKAKKTGKDPKYRLDPIECCKPRVINEIERIERNATNRARTNPVVIPAGAAALEVVRGKKSSIQKRRGSQFRRKHED